MEHQTKIAAEEGRQELLITREFNLPVELLFKAYVEPELVEQWMGTTVIQLENRKHGAWQFETKDQSGNVVFSSNGVIHEFVPNEKITRTFEMDGAFPVQLEFLEFKKIANDKSLFTMQIVFKSVEYRDRLLQLPFAYGINMAHNRLQQLVGKLNQ